MIKNEFENWFHSYLLHKTASCLDRDILRWAEPVLKMGFKKQALTDLELNGSQELLDAYIDIDKLKSDNQVLLECVDYFADVGNWSKCSRGHYAAVLHEKAVECLKQLGE